MDLIHFVITSRGVAVWVCVVLQLNGGHCVFLFSEGLGDLICVSQMGSSAGKSGAGFAPLGRTFLIKSLKTNFPKSPSSPETPSLITGTVLHCVSLFVLVSV